MKFPKESITAQELMKKKYYLYSYSEEELRKDWQRLKDTTEYKTGAQLNAAADQAVGQHKGDLDPYVAIIEGSSEFEVKEIKAVWVARVFWSRPSFIRRSRMTAPRSIGVLIRMLPPNVSVRRHCSNVSDRRQA